MPGVPAIAPHILTPALDAATVEGIETQLITLLASGRAPEVDAALDAGPLPPDHLVAVLARADARLRTGDVNVLDLQTLQRRAVRDQGPVGPHALWATALLAERLMLDGDHAAYAVATGALEELADDPLAPLPRTYGQARLLRVAAAVWLLTPLPDGLRAHQAHAEQAVRLMLRCGFVQEVAVVIGVGAVLQAVFLEVDPVANYARALDARAMFDAAAPSLNAIILDYFIGYLAIHLGDVQGARDASDRIERTGIHHQRLSPFVHYCRAWARLIDEGDTAAVIEDLDAALRLVNDDPRILQLWRQLITHQLLDRGSAHARRIVRPVFQLPPFGPADVIARDLLRARIALLEGSPVAVARLTPLLTELVDLGRERVAFVEALRLARDLLRAGETAGATELHQWALTRRDPTWELSGPVRALLQELGAPAPDDAGRTPAPTGDPAPVARVPTLAVRVLGPRLEVEVDGRLLALGRQQSLLLVALILNHPGPLEVDEASELLWPGTPVSATRLNSVVHRLRDKLGPARAAVGRTGRLFALDPARCTVDLWEYRRRLAGSTHELRHALRAVPGNFCTAELRHNAYVSAHRERFRAEWLRHARTLVGAGRARPAELHGALSALGFAAADLEGSEPL